MKFICIIYAWVVAGLASDGNNTIKIEWSPIFPLKFYQDVMLQCMIPNCCTNTTKWIGGPEGSLLTYQKHSLNNAKYKEIWGRNVNYLVIMNFELDDVNRVYTCYHGFDFYSRNLTFDSNQFEFLPTKETLYKQIKMFEGKVDVNAEFLEVYPKPDCKITFEGIDVSNHSKIELKQSHTYFYKVKYFLEYEVCAEECNGNLTMTCRIGSSNVTLFEVYLVSVFQARLCINNLFLWTSCVLLWIFCLYIVSKSLCKCRQLDQRNRIQSLQNDVLVCAILSLVLLIVVVIDHKVDGKCKTTTIQMNAGVAIITGLLFVLLGVLLVLYRKTPVNARNERRFRAFCEHVCFSCSTQNDTQANAEDVGADDEEIESV